MEMLCRSAAKGKSAAVQDAAARDGDGEMLAREGRLMRAAVCAIVGPRPSVRRSSAWEFAIVGSPPTVPMG